MIREIMDRNILFFVIAGIGLLGVFSRILYYRLYRTFMKESEKIASSQNKLIRQIRLKYENAYRVSVGVNNVEALVDKYIYSYKFLGMRLYGIKRFIAHAVFLCMLVGAAGAGLNWWLEGADEIALYYGGAVLGAAALMFISAYLFNIKFCDYVMHINVIDYLENTLAFRLKSECEADAEVKAERRRHQAKRKMEEQETDLPLDKPLIAGSEQVALTKTEKKPKKRLRKKTAEEDIMQMKRSLEQIAADSTEKHKEERKFTKEEQQAIVEEILKEYLS